jgi:hypothetical protein
MFRKFLFVSAGFVFVANLIAQIEPKDSTFQVISYWSKGEKQSYSVTESKIKINKTDTTSKVITSYKLDVTVLDSTDKNYKLEWKYSNYTTSDKSELVKDLSGLAEGMKMIVVTNENGEFQELENWKEVQGIIKKAMGILQSKYASLPNINQIIKSVNEKFATKELIEINCTKEIVQFLSFHGGKYKLGEVLTGKSEQMSGLGKPIDNNYEILLDELNISDNNGVFRMSQTLDSKQLTDQTYEMLKKMMPKGRKIMPRNKMPEVTNSTGLASRIHNAGWVIYSIETKTTNSLDVQSIEERVIDIQ